MPLSGDTSATPWRFYLRRQLRLLRLVYLQAVVIAPGGALLNWATTVTASFYAIFLHACLLFVLAPLFIVLVHCVIEAPLVALGRMPATWSSREIGLRTLCQALGLLGSALVVAKVLEATTSMRNLFAGPLLAAVALAFAALVIHTLYETIRRREIALLRFRSLQAESRFRSLTEQVQPHFLFNALNALAELTHSDAERAGEGILALARMYQTIHDASQRSTIPTREEAELVRSYLSVQALRLGNRFQWRLSVDLDAEAFLVPPFTMLLIVENAVKHGVAAVPGEAQLETTVTCERGRWVLRVTNTRGRPDARVKGLGAGLTNLTERLKHVYGDRASFSLDHGEVDTVAIACISLDVA